MVFEGAEVYDHKGIFEEKGEVLFGGSPIGVVDFGQQEHFVALSSVKIIVIVDDMDQEYFFFPVRSESDSVEGGEGDPAFNFVLVVDVDELFDEDLEDAGGTHDIENGPVGQHDYPVFAFPVAVVLEDVHGEDNLLVFLEYFGQPLLLLQVQQVALLFPVAALHRLYA